MEFLDDKRLGKQRVEAAQILEILLDKPVLPRNVQSLIPFDRRFGPWTRHPAVLMWKGYEDCLKLYLDCVIGEWIFRGFTNSIVVPDYPEETQAPPWLGYEPFHLSHRSNLLRKNVRRYREFWPDDPTDLDYFWPTHEGF